jgi:xanthine dehydrogenase small subunit
MRTAISSLTLRRPRTVTSALGMMADERLTPLAGCTDVYVNLQFGASTSTRFVDLWPLDELRGIARRGKTLRIGALTTYTDLIVSPLVQRHVPMLAAAAREIGGRQSQHRGTLAGNVANASPAGDTLPVLAAAQAMLVLRSVRGTREVPLLQFYTGYRASVLDPDEIIEAIEIPPVTGRQWWRKVGTRRAQAISKVMMAGVRGDEVRVAIGSVAPTVIRVPRTEAVLSGRKPLADAQATLLDEVAPIDDLRSTAEYRRRVAANLLARFWDETSL